MLQHPPVLMSIGETPAMYNTFLSENKYSRWYINIITNAKNRTLNDIYTEKHHIMPKSFGGSDVIENIVTLTYKEHFLCHWLLTKCTLSDKHRRSAFSALSRMSRREDQTPLASWQYVLLNIAAKNAMIGREVTEETRQKNRDARYKQLQDPVYIENWERGMANRKLPAHTEERKEKARQNIIKYNQSDEHKQVVSKTFKGVPKSEAQRKKQSETMKNGAAAFGERNAMSDEINRQKVALSKIGLQALHKNGNKKMAKPGTEKWHMLIADGYTKKC